MAIYECICCGATIEGKKTTNCSICGYKMFESPFDRRTLLKREIQNFLKLLRIKNISCDSFHVFRRVSKEDNRKTGKQTVSYIRKSEDDKRFPDFSKIQRYVCFSEKTEIFYKRLNTTIDQIQKHLHTPYSQDYCVSFEKITKDICALDHVLKKAFDEIGISLELPNIEIAEAKLAYSETANLELLALADILLEKLKSLTEKIWKFIKQNNIYGAGFQKIQSKQSSLKRNQDPYVALQEYAIQVDTVLKTQYVVDIFEDGSKELSEMLKTLWDSIEVLLSVPILEKQFKYTLSDGSIADDKSIKELLFLTLNSRYQAVDLILFADNFLSDESEEKLFDIYNKMIELDSFGFMKINKSTLLRVGESEKKLDSLVGLSGIKESIKKIKAYSLANQGSDNLNIHMCFLGNPGTGKTEVARYIASILYENKILPTKNVIEVDRSGLVSQYFGATAEKTNSVIERAMGGVLFVDEAYALNNNSEAGLTDYGKEAIDTLVKAMEDHRGKFCVIFAGYKKEMLRMLSANPGFQSRIQFMLDFPDYSRSELQCIAQQMAEKQQYTISETALEMILDITDIKRKEPNFANARELRNILDQVIMCQNMRCVDTYDKVLGIADVQKYIRDAKLNLPIREGGFSKKILTAEEELDQLVGLDTVKRMIKKIKAYAKRNKNEVGFNLHMCFYGNPGTGKTEVARILSRILYEAGVLPEAKLIETDGHGLLGKAVGETAPKTLSKISDAMNGVLFIDEAYSLSGTNFNNGGSANYGEEAITVLLKEMEDHRGQFCVILAGYKEEMQNLISSNPGFKSRLQFTLEFPDYSRDELGQIAMAFLSNKKYSIEPDALVLLLDIGEYFRRQKNFANARTIRNILDQVIMNQNLRTEDSHDNCLIIRCDVEEYLADEGIDLNTPNHRERTIGFL